MSYKLNDTVEVYTTEEADERFSAGNVQVEKERAEAAESALGERIDAEVTRATGAEGTNASNIAQNTSDIASLSSTVTQNTSDISANTSAITAEVTRATTAEGQLSTDLITESTRATNAEQTNATAINNNAAVIEANRAKQIFVFELEADKPAVNYDATTKIRINDGQLIFVKDTKKWYTATTTSTGGDPVTWTEFQMPGGGGGAVYIQNLVTRDVGENTPIYITPDAGYNAFEEAEINVPGKIYYCWLCDSDLFYFDFSTAPADATAFANSELLTVVGGPGTISQYLPGGEKLNWYNQNCTNANYTRVSDSSFKFPAAGSLSDIEFNLVTPLEQINL